MGSLKSQQKRLASYSHARQVEVVASLDTAETTSHARPEEAGGGNGVRPDGEADVQRDGREPTEGGGGGGEGRRPQVEDDVEDTDKAVLSTIALETDMVSGYTYCRHSTWCTSIRHHQEGTFSGGTGEGRGGGGLVSKIRLWKHHVEWVAWMCV